MSDRGRALRGYAVGYVVAMALTAAAYAVVVWPTALGDWATRETLLGVVLVLGLVQMVVHFRFFLHIDLGRSSRHDLQLILFTVLIVALMVAGTFVVLLNLRARMM